MAKRVRATIIRGRLLVALFCALALILAGCSVPIEYHGETADLSGELAFEDDGVHLTFDQLRVGTQEAQPCGVHLFRNGTLVLDNPPMAEKIVIGPDGLGLEHFEYYGPCPSNGAVGNGALTASFTSDGTMCTFNWPRASYYDHLNYLTLSRQLPRMGAKAGAGSFAGIAYSPGEAGRSGFTWLRDAGWRTGQSYLSADDNVLVTSYDNASLGLLVTGYDFVMPGGDVLVRRFAVEKRPGSPVRSAKLLYYENFDPCLWKVPLLPVSDWLMDGFNDYAAFYDPGHDALVHYRPESESSDRPPAGDTSQCGSPGVYIAVSADRPSSQFQCGFDARGIGGEQVPGKPKDSYYDAMDGELSGSASVSGYANAALSYDLGELREGAPAGTTIYISAADGCERSLGLLSDCRSAGYDANLAETRNWWRRWLSGAVLPDSEDPEILEVYKRSLIALKMTYDASTGAVVVSPARQPPFGEDWPRDGSYINYALDMAGYHDMARRHALFYDRIQRPGGTWGMCYYSDGMEGGPLVLQSDTVGHIPWAMWEHYQATGNAAYLRSVYPGMRKTANWAVAWRDPKNGLPLPTFEDDSITPKQGLHGAVSLYMGLEATIKAAGVLKKDALARKGWRRRADELKQAIVDNFWDEEGQTFGGDFHSSWVIWPANLFGPDDTRTVGHARYLRDMLVSRMNLEGDSGGYEGLGIIALSRLWKGDPGKMAFLKSAVAWLARDVATPGTGHFGEFYFMVDWNGDGRKEYVNYSAIPHGWNHALFVISSLEVFGPR